MRLFVIAITALSVASLTSAGDLFNNNNNNDNNNKGLPWGGNFDSSNKGARSLGCIDYYVQCTDPQYQYFCWIRDPGMLLACPKTCGECGEKPCVDDFGSWYCRKEDCGFDQFMRANCRKTCGECSGTTTPKWRDWSTWGVCNKNCGTGTRRRTRTCLQGNCQGLTYEDGKCNTQKCPTIPKWSAWGPYGVCSKDCGGGERTRTRTCVGGTTCPGLSRETVSCNTAACPPGKWGPFGAWSACTQPCGMGTQRQTRTCLSGAGKCTGDSYRERPCETQPCRWRSWEDWGSCSKPCGGGKRTRTRQCPRSGKCSGPSSESDACNTNACACNKPSVWSAYSGWSACNANCGGGKQARTRVCNKGCSDGPECVGKSTDTRACNTQKCIADNVCSKPCGYGVKLLNNKYVACNTNNCPTPTCNSFQNRMKNDAELRCCNRAAKSLPGVPDFDDSVQSRIIGGKNSAINEFPWQIYMMPTYCGGCIIHSRWILTAGHCVAYYQPDSWGTVLDPSVFKIWYGVVYISQANMQSGAGSKSIVKRIVRHNSFNFPLHDIALMELTGNIQWSSAVKPAALPAANFMVPDDTTCHVSGFGVVSNAVRRVSSNMQDVAVEKFNMNICKKGYNGKENQQTVDNHGEKFICAGSLNEKIDSCQGDSGGGLICQTPKSCAFVVAGLVSFGPSACATPSQPGMYINVAYYRTNFIDKYVN